MSKPHYYYKTSGESQVGIKLQEFMNRCAEAEETARQWADKVGASHYYESTEGMAGGVGAVEFDNTITKDGWEKIATPDGRTFYLPEEGSELEKEMYSLPVVSEAELIGILNFIPQKNKDGLPWPFSFGNETPVVFLHHGYWYIDVPYRTADISVTPIEEKEFYRRRMAAINKTKV